MLNASLPPGARFDRWLSALFAALFGLFPISVGLSNVALLLVVASWIWLLRDGGLRDTLRSEPWIWLLGGLYLLVLLGMIHTPADPSWIGLHLNKYARLLYAIVIVCLLAGRPRLQRLALAGFVTAMLVTLALTWLSVWIDLPWTWSWKNREIHPGNHSVFGDYITQNVMMALLCVIAVQRSVMSAGAARKAAWGAVALLGGISITHLSVGRTGFVVLLAGLLTAALMGLRGRIRLGAIGAVVACCVLGLALSSTLQNRFELAIEQARHRETDIQVGVGHRLFNYRTTPRLVAEKPWLGHGTGAYHVEICRVLDQPQTCPTYSWHPHNQFLFLAADNGIVGAVLYLLLILYLYRIAGRSERAEARIPLGALATIFLVDSLFNSPLWSSIESQFFMYMTALFVSMARTQATAPTE